MTIMHGVEVTKIWSIPCNGVTGIRVTHKSRAEVLDADGETTQVEISSCASFNRELSAAEAAREILRSRSALQGRGKN